MQLVWVVILSAVLASALGDCGCLKCAKHLRVVSPPGAPITVIERGEPCICERAVPFHLEYPAPAPPAPPRKTYGYKVQTVQYVKPEPVPMCQHGYRVEVPYIPPPPAHSYHQGLTTKMDRIVMPARDECPPPPPNCCRPIIEYIQPECHERCPPRYHYCGLTRRKRDLYNDRNEDFGTWKREIDWSRILEPKPIRQSNIRNLWQTQSPQPLPKYKTNTIPREATENKPLRINIPLNPTQRFFPWDKYRTKTKPRQTVHQDRFETDPAPDRNEKPFRSKTLSKLLQKSGKFADIENVKISLPQRPKKSILKRRRPRSITVKDQASPFYRIIRKPIESSGQALEDVGEDIVELREKFLKPFDVETILPQDQVFYVLNTPIRMLNEIHKIREHVNPMVKSIPNVLDTSTNYVLNLGSRFRRGSVDFFKEFVGNIKGLPRKVFSSFVAPSRLNRKNRRSSQTFRDTSRRLSKRAIVKLVEDDDVYDYLRRKLPFLTPSEDNYEGDSEEETLLLPVLPELPQKSKKSRRAKTNQIELMMEELEPKLVLRDGRPFLDIEGTQKPLIPNKKRRVFRNKSTEEDVQSMIGDLIEETRLMASNPRSRKSLEYESEMSTSIIKDEITSILDEVQLLMDEDFYYYSDIYEQLLRLQHLKDAVVVEWKQILIKKKHNESGAKISLLNTIDEMLSLKESVVEQIGEILADGRSFNTNTLVKKLIRLQKMHCILVKTVEDFAESIRYQTPCNVPKEIERVDLLEQLDLVSGKSMVELEDSLKQERDDEVEKQLKILDALKHLLEGDMSVHKTKEVNDVAKLLWEIRNCDKLQTNTVADVNDKIRYGAKIRKELKIIFDLEKQREHCLKKLDGALRDISKGKIKNRNVKDRGNVLSLKPHRKNVLPKKLSSRKKNKHK